VPDDVPKFIIDPKIPTVHGVPDVIKIEEKATVGVTKLVDELMK